MHRDSAVLPWCQVGVSSPEVPSSLQVKALGCDGSTSLATWLDGLGLHEYLPNFLSSGYRTLECVKNLWELEIINVRGNDLHSRPSSVKDKEARSVNDAVVEVLHIIIRLSVCLCQGSS